MSYTITLDHIRSVIAKIADTSVDNERAHILEDDLHVAVLVAIANGTCEDPREAARIAASSASIEFTRWHA